MILLSFASHSNISEAIVAFCINYEPYPMILFLLLLDFFFILVRLCFNKESSCHITPSLMFKILPLRRANTCSHLDSIELSIECSFSPFAIILPNCSV